MNLDQITHAAANLRGAGKRLVGLRRSEPTGQRSINGSYYLWGRLTQLSHDLVNGNQGRQVQQIISILQGFELGEFSKAVNPHDYVSNCPGRFAGLEPKAHTRCV